MSRLSTSRWLREEILNSGIPNSPTAGGIHKKIDFLNAYLICAKCECAHKQEEDATAHALSGTMCVIK